MILVHIYLSWLDRLRVLWHGKIEYHGKVIPDPGDFEVEGSVYVPHILPQKPLGYEKAKD